MGVQIVYLHTKGARRAVRSCTCAKQLFLHVSSHSHAEATTHIVMERVHLHC